jgi:hypothetical protein
MLLRRYTVGRISAQPETCVRVQIKPQNVIGIDEARTHRRDSEGVALENSTSQATLRALG